MTLFGHFLSHRELYTVLNLCEDVRRDSLNNELSTWLNLNEELKKKFETPRHNGFFRNITILQRGFGMDLQNINL